MLTHQNRISGKSVCESRRDSVLQPRVGVFSANPGERQKQEIQPRRGCVSDASSKIQNRHNPFQGCELISLPPQGWLKNANPGLEDEIPSGFIPRRRERLHSSRNCNERQARTIV